MKVLITGGGGQVGHALAATAPANWEVTAPPRSDLDITDRAAIDRALDGATPDAVVNAAAYTAVDKAEVEPELAHLVNGHAAAQLTAACRERGIRLVHYSTDFVFDGRASTAYRPDDAPAPLSAYGRSKLAGEAVAGTPGNLVIRTAWVYSAGRGNFVATVLRLLNEREELRIVADQVGTPTHALSLARATWQLLAQGAEGILHFTDAGVASWYDFAVAIQEEALAAGLIDRNVPIVPIATHEYPAPATRPAYGVLDKAETWRRLGAPAQHWRVELRAMLAELPTRLQRRSDG